MLHTYIHTYIHYSTYIYIYCNVHWFTMMILRTQFVTRARFEDEWRAPDGQTEGACRVAASCRCEAYLYPLPINHLVRPLPLVDLFLRHTFQQLNGFDTVHACQKRQASLSVIIWINQVIFQILLSPIPKLQGQSNLPISLVPK